MVVVSGGSSGIGFATAAHFLASGDKVAFYGENAARVDAACEMLASRFGTGPVIGKVVDQRDRAALEDFFMHVSRTWGAPDVLVCNAGISPKGPDGARIPFARISPEAWQDVLTTNLTAAAWACQFVLPAMALKGCGRIVLVGSVASRALPRIAGGAYTVSKAGLS
ncbi:MAG: 3-ketoacyl-ACP reductase, partial [Rhizobiales bacterium 32-66-8]